jgi:uncharacterized protein YciI
MARWAAIFTDNPDAAAVRDTQRQAHFDYLARHADRILLAGGLRPSEDGWWSGGLWIIEAGTRAEAAALCEEDPFFVHGLRRGYELQLWGRAPCYGEPDTIRL